MPDRVIAAASRRRGRSLAALAWIDRLPLPLAVAAGVALGAAAGGAGFFYLASPAWAVGWVALFVGLGLLGGSATPLFDEPLPAAKPPPERRPARPRCVVDGQLEMIELPGGAFLMGSPDSDPDARDYEKPQHAVTVSSFRMATTPVTVGLHRKVMQRSGGAGEESADRLPATGVSWHDAITFCNRLSELAGYRACYTRAGDDWQCDWQADGYRLPTEAEWEYACRAGSTTRYCFGDDAARLGDYAWYAANAGAKPHPVASKLPNACGLYDMHGNVWEWCWDWSAPYAAAPGRDPHGPPKPLQGWRVLRGGSFVDSPADLRSAVRFLAGPEVRNGFVGFRCVRVPPQRSTD